MPASINNYNPLDFDTHEDAETEAIERLHVKKGDAKFTAAMYQAIRRGAEHVLTGTFIDLTSPGVPRIIRGETILPHGSPASECADIGDNSESERGFHRKRRRALRRRAI
jgi:hypothetical protein